MQILRKLILHQIIYHLTFLSSNLRVSSATKIPNPLNGKHLRVLAMEYPVSLTTTRNSTGHVISMKGELAEFIQVVSKSLNFSYSFLTERETLAENPMTGRGAIYYILKGEADFCLTTSFATPYRNRVADMPSYWFVGPFGLIVPYPKETVNITSTLRIFTYEVWAAIFGSVLAMLLYLRFASFEAFRETQSHHNDKSGSTNVKNPSANYRLPGIIGFVLGNLVSQGQHFYSNKLFFRTAAGTWCLACFFLVQMYSSILTSRLMAPNQKPIANSFHDIANSPQVAGLTMEYKFGAHQILADLKFGDYKKVYDKLAKDPSLLCNQTEACLRRVKEGGDAAYIASVDTTKTIIMDDLKSSGTCNYYLLKDTILSNAIHFFMTKDGPYTRRMGIEIQRFHQAGLFLKWGYDYVPNPRQCTKLETRQEKELKRISLTHLSSAFVILAIGIVLSLFVFIWEKVSKRST